MIKLFIYLLESSAVLALFYVLYILILRRETFFSLNRFFLIGILVFSLLFPLVSFDFNPSKVVSVERPIEEISKLRMSYYDAMAAWEFDNLTTLEPTEKLGVSTISFGSDIDWFKITQTALFVLYVIGIVVCLSRTVWTLRGILKMTLIYPSEKIDGVNVIKVPNPIAAFSFLNNVFVHDTLVNTPDFDQIMNHEKTHIQQRHSIDLIFVQLLAAFLWFNPLIWQLIKSLKTTHEYIADNKVINAGYSLVEYQSLLLRQLISNNSFGLVHNFNLSFIKKRITMMKIKESGLTGRVKVVLVLSAVVLFSLFIVQCNAVIDEPIKIKKEIKQIKNDTHSGLSEIDTPYSLSLVSDAPVFPGCENSSSEFHIRKCLSESMSNYFRENFDLNILTNNPVKRKRVLLFLLINQKGEVSLSRSPFTNNNLESEIRRVIKGIPKLIPGIRHGLPVNVTYYVSISFLGNKLDFRSSYDPY